MLRATDSQRGSELEASFCPDPDTWKKGSVAASALLHPAICAVPVHPVPSTPSGALEPTQRPQVSPAPPRPAPPRGSGLYTELGLARECGGPGGRGKDG